jgi:hypothetical protein
MAIIFQHTAVKPERRNYSERREKAAPSNYNQKLFLSLGLVDARIYINTFF